VTPSFTHMSITRSNQIFINYSHTVDAEIMKLTSDSICGNGLQEEYSVLLSSVLQCLCDFSNQSFSIYDDLFLSASIFVHCSPLLVLSSHDSCMQT
jgi:hypothetical protein